MAVKRVDATNIDNGVVNYVGILEYQGLSTDTKPTLIESQSGSQFIELDTGSIFIWHINAWFEL